MQAAAPLEVGCAFYSHLLHTHRWQAVNACAHRSSIIGKPTMFSLRGFCGRERRDIS